MSKSNPKTRNQFGKKKQCSSLTLTLTLIPKSVESETKENKNQRRGKGIENLAVVKTGARGKERRAGALLAGLRPKRHHG